jgi:hypothetical protein
MSADLGPIHRDEDALRLWVEWLYTNNPNSLEMPAAYFESRLKSGLTDDQTAFRRQAEWDDHGETYPMEMEGPGLTIQLTLPPGAHVVSLYDYNKDGTFSFNKLRDYIVTIRKRATSVATAADGESVDICRSRIVNFRSGVYKRFVADGPCDIDINLQRNHSWNTILAGVFVDPLDEDVTAYGSKDELNDDGTALSSLAHQNDLTDALQLWDRLVAMKSVDRAAWASLRRLACGAILAAVANHEHRGQSDNTTTVAELRLRKMAAYAMGDFPEWERTRSLLHLPVPREIERSIHWDAMSDYSGREADILPRFFSYCPLQNSRR